MATGRAGRWMRVSRWSRDAAITVAVITAAVAAVVTVSDAARPRPVVDRVPALAQPVTVERVLEGDLLEVAVPTSGSVWAVPGPVTVRLAGVEVGDVGPTCVATARDHLGALLPTGSTVWAVAGGPAEESGTQPAYLWTTAVGLVNDVLAAHGDVTVVSRPEADNRYTARLAQSAEAASRRGVGRWGDCG